MLFNHTVLMSGPDYFSNDAPINPLMTQGEAIDLKKAADEHVSIRHALETIGVTVHTVIPPEHCQDGVFTANWALVRGDTAVMARLPNARRAEQPYAGEVLQKLGKKIVWLPDDIEKFSGQGDALPCGNYLFCGDGYRSDARAQEFAAMTLGYERIQLKTMPLIGTDGQPVINRYSGLLDSFYYDIDLALSVLKFPTATSKGLIAWCPAAFTSESQVILRAFDGVDKIEVMEEEVVSSLVCNLVSTGKTVVMNDGAPMFKAAIEERGLRTVRLKMPELAKGGGSMRCTTLSFND